MQSSTPVNLLGRKRPKKAAQGLERKERAQATLFHLKLAEPSSERQFIMYEAIRKGAPLEKLHDMTHIKMWFLQQILGSSPREVLASSRVVFPWGRELGH